MDTFPLKQEGDLVQLAIDIALGLKDFNPDKLGDPVLVEHGGTEATNAKDARVNLGIETPDGTVTSDNADYAEIGQWVDGNPDHEDRIGYFVSIDTETAGTTMVKANSESDVRGVTVVSPAFSGNASPDKFDSDGKLLNGYEYVAVMGLVSVIDNGTCTINKRCMAADDGTAIPSINNMGYQVIDRIDDTHILIALEPGADMLIRIKKDISELQSSGGGGGGGGGSSGNLRDNDYVIVSADVPSVFPMLWFDTDWKNRQTDDNEVEAASYSVGSGADDYVVIGAIEPTNIPMLWLNTGWRDNGPTSMLWDLDEPTGSDEVSADIDGELYAVTNAKLNGEPTVGKYSFTIL